MPAWLSRQGILLVRLGAKRQIACCKPARTRKCVSILEPSIASNSLWDSGVWPGEGKTRDAGRTNSPPFRNYSSSGRHYRPVVCRASVHYPLSAVPPPPPLLLDVNVKRQHQDVKHRGRGCGLPLGAWASTATVRTTPLPNHRRCPRERHQPQQCLPVPVPVPAPAPAPLGLILLLLLGSTAVRRQTRPPTRPLSNTNCNPPCPRRPSAPPESRLPTLANKHSRTHRHRHSSNHLLLLLLLTSITHSLLPALGSTFSTPRRCRTPQVLAAPQSLMADIRSFNRPTLATPLQ